MRQTDLSFEELMERINRGIGLKCFLMNELGRAFLDGEKRAEQVLRDALNDTDEAVQFPAFCCLKIKEEELAPETQTKLEEFEKICEKEFLAKAAVQIKLHRKTD